MGTKKGAGQTAPTMEKPKPAEQAKNASIQADADAHALPEITVRIDKLFCDEDKKLKAFASANIGPFAVHGIRVFENDKGMFINMPSNSYTDAQGNKQYPMNYTITYKTSDGKVLDTKSGTVDAAAETRNALRITSPSFDGYVLKNDSDAVVTGSMISWNFPASNYVRHGSGSYTVYYEKACKMVVHYVYGASRRTATVDKTAYGKRGSSYTIYSPTISGYTPSKSSVSGSFSSESSSATVY